MLWMSQLSSCAHRGKKKINFGLCKDNSFLHSHTLCTNFTVGCFLTCIQAQLPLHDYMIHSGKHWFHRGNQSWAQHYMLTHATTSQSQHIHCFGMTWTNTWVLDSAFSGLLNTECRFNYGPAEYCFWRTPLSIYNLKMCGMSEGKESLCQFCFLPHSVLAVAHKLCLCCLLLFTDSSGWNLTAGHQVY